MHPSLLPRIRYPSVLEVKFTLVHALRLCTDRTAHRGTRGIALLFHDHGTRRGWRVSVTLRPLFTPGKDPVPTVQEAGWAPGPVWTGTENLTPTGIRSPDRPARSHSAFYTRLIYILIINNSEHSTNAFSSYYCYNSPVLFSIIMIFLLWRCDPTRVMASFLRLLDRTQRRTTVGRTPLNE